MRLRRAAGFINSSLVSDRRAACASLLAAWHVRDGGDYMCFTALIHRAAMSLSLVRTRVALCGAGA